jgi:hypothetical protein
MDAQHESLWLACQWKKKKPPLPFNKNKVSGIVHQKILLMYFLKKLQDCIYWVNNKKFRNFHIDCKLTNARVKGENKIWVSPPTTFNDVVHGCQCYFNPILIHYFAWVQCRFPPDRWSNPKQISTTNIMLLWCNAISIYISQNLSQFTPPISMWKHHESINQLIWMQSSISRFFFIYVPFALVFHIPNPYP